MTVSIISVGDELLIGQTVNTNAAWLGEVLTAAGASVWRVITVGDDEAEIAHTLLTTLSDSELVVMTGGLGPTHDDITKKAIALALEIELERVPGLLDDLSRKYQSRGRTMPAASSVMADMPKGWTALPNNAGMAPGLWYRGRVPGVQHERLIAVLPGVPVEMRALMSEQVLPRIGSLQGPLVTRQKTLLTAGVPESTLSERINASSFLSSGCKLAFLPGHGIVRLRLSATASDQASALRRLAEFEAHVRESVGNDIFGEGECTLAMVVGELLTARGQSIAVAESCTGGGVADALTDVPGASAYLVAGLVTYSNASKRQLLGVDAAALREQGAVSEIVALQMAEGAARLLGTDLAISTTGVAGPGGGTEEKPVGTVWIGFFGPEGSYARQWRFGTSRRINKVLSVNAALDLLRRQLLRSEKSTS